MSSTSKPKYDFGYFKEWCDSCKVRRVQEAYDDLSSTAKKHEKSVEEEMQARGYKDHSEFYKSCPKFDLLCWPTEMAELGSGVVLYFHFLAFLICFLALALVLMIYPMAYYGSEGKLETWNWDAGGFTNEDTDRCECKGSNEGFRGPDSFGGSDYGSSCEAWDVTYCVAAAAPTSSTPSELGDWCCRSWCYADEDCQQTKSGSTSNVKVVNGGVTLVRSYTACSDNSALLETCSSSSLLGVDIRYPYGLPYDQDNCMTEVFYADATPGNLGPDNGSDEGVLVMHFVVLVMLCLAILIKNQYQERIEVQVDSRTTQPNDYAVLAHGLPSSATDEKEIASWFRQHAIGFGHEAEIVKVVIGWDGAEYRSKIGKLRAITAQLKDTDPSADKEEFERLQKEAAEIRKDFMSTAPTVAARLSSSGYVVVIFRYQEDLRRCLSRWDTHWGRFANRDVGGCWGCLPGAPLPQYPGEVPARVWIRRAPNPQDINWEDLGAPLQEKLLRLLKTNAAMGLLIVAAFGICYFVKWLSRGSGGACHTEAIISGTWVSLLPVLAIASANATVNVAARKFGRYELHATKGQEVMSQALKMGFAMMVNTSGVLLFVNAQPKEWYAAGGLLDDLFTLLLVVGWLRPVMLFFDLPHYIRALLPYLGFKKRKLTQEKIDHWNEVEAKGPPKNKEEQSELKQVRAEVEYFKKVTQPSEMLMTRRYAYAVNIFMCALYYLPLMPIIPVLAIISLCIQFCVDKYLIVRWFKRPPVHDSAQAVGSLHFIRWLGCIGFPLAAVFFLKPSWQEKAECWQWFVPSILVGVGFSLVPMRVTRAVLGLHCLLSKQGVAVRDSSRAQDYYHAQHMWKKENKYHLSQFLYKGLPPSVNPENLTPGELSTVPLQSVKDSCAASVGHGAAAVLAGTAAVVDDAVADSDTGASSGPEPRPAAAAAAPPAETLKSDSTADTPDIPPLSHAAADDGPEPGSAASLPAVTETPADPSKTGAEEGGESYPVWEYESKDKRYAKYADDCHGFIERKYQDFKRGGGGKSGHAQVKVKTGSLWLSVDFERMTQMVMQDGKPSGKVRRIRRRES